MTEEVSDEEIKQLEEELKKLESKDTSYGSPTAVQKESLFKFFNKILTIKDTTRVGNLSTPEIGLSRLSLRGNKSIALYAEVEGLNIVRDYFNNQANILSETSMSKKGFFLQTVITQIRKEKKGTDKSQEKRKWFTGSKKEAE